MAMAASLATMEVMLSGGVLENVNTVGQYFMERLRETAARHPVVTEVRGRGLMLGVELDREGAPVVAKALEEGLLMNCTAGNVLRFLPPLIIQKEDVDQAVDILNRCMGEL